MIRLPAFLLIGFGLLIGQQALAQSTSNCITKQSEEEYQKCIEGNNVKRKVDPQIWGAGNSSATIAEPLEEDITDTLPPASASHVRSEMVKKVYTQVGEWTPQARIQEFDFEPSEAAKADSKLSAEEEAAFAAAVSDYHDREEAAYRQRQDNGEETETQENTSTVAGKVNAGAAQDGETANAGQARSALDILGDLNVLNSGQAGRGTEEAQSAEPGGRTVVDGDVNFGGTGGGNSSTPPEQAQTAQSQASNAANPSTEFSEQSEASQSAQTGTQRSAADFAAQNARGDQGTSDQGTGEQNAASEGTQTSTQRSAADLAAQIAGSDQASTQQASSTPQDASDASNQPGAATAQTKPLGSTSDERAAFGETPDFDKAASGTQRSAADLAAQISSTDRATTEQSETQLASRSGQVSGSSDLPRAPTRPIPAADPISAALLADLFADNQDTLAPSTSPAPLQEWSDPDAGSVDTAALEAATQALLAQDDASATPQDPALLGASQSQRAEQKEQARLALFGGLEGTASQSDETEETLPPQTAARLLTLSLP